MIKKIQIANYSRLKKEKLNRYDFEQNSEMSKETEKNKKDKFQQSEKDF